MTLIPTDTYTTSDLSRRTGDVIAAAYKGPVTLTQRNKARFVMVTVELFDELVAKADPRRAGKTREMPEELAAEFGNGVDAYVRKQSGVSFEDIQTKDRRRREAADRLLAIAPALEAAGVPRLTEEEIDAEVKAVRAARRKRRGARKAR